MTPLADAMNSFTRIGLPVLLVVGAVFLVTMATRYTSEPDPTLPAVIGPPGKDGPAKAAKEQPLRFYSLVANNADRDKAPMHLKYWSPEVEVDQPGYYVYWAANKHPKPVTIRANGTSCTCASVEYAVVPPANFQDFTVLTAVAGNPLLSAAMPFTGALAQAVLAGKLDWQPLYSKEKGMTPGEVPAAGPAGPQMAAVRMNWSGKGSEGSRNIQSEIIATLPGAAPAAYPLDAAISIVPSFLLLKRVGAAWESAHELDMGELRENGVSSQAIYAVSPHRLFLSPLGSLTGGDHPCVRISPPVPATPDEIQSLLAYAPEGKPVASRVSSMYKLTVTVHERVAAGADGSPAHQMELGVLDRRLKVENGPGGDAKGLILRGRVLGDIRILAGADSGRIDLGNGFSVDQDHSKTVTLIAERPGLDVTLLEKETRPNYVKVKFVPEKDLDGRKNWRLTVTVPKGTLYGALPEASVIMLATNESPPRKIRLPLRGASYDSGTAP